LPLASTAAVRWSAGGGNGSSPIASKDWKSKRVRVVPGLFPPDLVVQVKAWACELPATHDLPLSRWRCDDLAREVCQTGLVASISGSTIWRWLHQDAIRPWYHRSWIFPRDPNFAEKAGRLLDLYAREWEGKSLKDDEFVISADEKTSIQARRTRILPLRRLGLHGCAGRTSRQNLWPLRDQEWDRSL